MNHAHQLKLELLKKTAIAADAVVRSHTPGTVPNATSEQMQTAKLYMTMAVPGLVLAMFDEIERLEADAERLRMQLAACGVVAMANTPESAAKSRDMHPDYMSASCQDVMRIVDSEMANRADAERFRFLLEVEGNDEFCRKLDEHCEGLDAPDSAIVAVDLLMQLAKDNGLWPIKPELVLTEDAQADRDAFNENYGDGNCSCHNNAPCSSCTHPGNPTNQEEDSACWTVAP